MRHAVVLAIAFTAGCIEPHLTECNDGRACSADLVCDEVHHGCVRPDQLSACIGLPDTSPCSASGIEGACHGEVCIEPGCGNRVAELAAREQCDDGNHVSGDGCSADCTSNERCGNSVRDEGEECEDGNLTSHDGCSSGCKVESLAWSAFPIQWPTLINARRIAFDQARRRLVLVSDPATWEWDGEVWKIVALTLPDPAWKTNALVYDADRQRVVMFGEVSSTTVAEWNGSAWSQVATSAPTPVPFPDYPTVDLAVYDSIQHRIMTISTGGTAIYVPATATWQPQQVAPFSIDAGTQIAFDVARNRVVVVLQGNSASSLAEWDGTIWTTKVGPPARAGWAVTYDGTRNAVVTVGGIVVNTSVGTAYAWTGSTWTNLGTPIPARVSGVAWYDATDGSLQGTSGYGVTPYLFLYSDLWNIVGTTVSVRTPDMPRSLGQLVYDPSHDRILQFGAEIWSFDGTWRKLTSASSPSTSTEMVVDPVRGGVLGFDIVDKTTWIFDDEWHPLAIPPLPENPVSGKLVYDYANRRAVLILNQDTGLKTWSLESNGTGWVPLVTTNRLGYTTSAAYDPGNQRIVAYEDSSTYPLVDLVGDTWTASLSPGAYYEVGGSLARSSVVLIPRNQAPMAAAMWERRGDVWTSHGALPIQVTSGTGLTERAYGRLEIQMSTDAGTLMLERQYTSSTPDETCADGIDADGDGLAGCDDADCWWKCHPACPYQASCALP